MARAAIAAAVVTAGLGGCDHTLPLHAQRAEDVRELDMLERVPVDRMSREAFAARAADRADNLSEETLAYYRDSYGRLGYFDLGLDLRPVFASSSDWVGATYSPSSKRITLVGDARDDILVHEYVHALQDQHFDLVAFDRLETTDSFLARRAVVEGDATLAQLRFVVAQDGETLDAVDWTALLASWREFGTSLLHDAEIPVVFLDYVSFAYPFGLAYTAANLTGVGRDGYTPAPHDWERENALFEVRPPDTSEQILAGYLPAIDTPRPPPEAVGLAVVPGSLATRFDTVDWDALGAWYLYLLLFPLEEAGVVTDGLAMASRWRGDGVLFVRDADSGQPGLVWVTAWDDQSAAADFAVALQLIHKSQNIVIIDENTVAGTSAGEPVRVTRRGSRVAIARNVAPDDAPQLIDAAFQPRKASPPRKHPPLSAVTMRLGDHARAIGAIGRDGPEGSDRTTAGGDQGGARGAGAGGARAAQTASKRRSPRGPGKDNAF